MSKANKIENIQNLQECIDYIMDNRSGWTQFTSWYMEKHGANRKYANKVWSKAWEIISEDFSDSVQQSVNQTLVELERIKEDAQDNGDRRIWLETVKYQNKIRGGEIERQQVDVNLKNVNLSWGQTDESKK
jgi:vacuolar-type H+-ATPase subunit I/STV1